MQKKDEPVLDYFDNLEQTFQQNSGIKNLNDKTQFVQLHIYGWPF